MKSLKDFCVTDHQRKLIELYEQNVSMREIARQLGQSSHSAVMRSINSVKARAAKAGFAPDSDVNNEVAAGFRMKGYSTLYNGEGKPVMQWVKTSADLQAQHEAMIIALEEMKEGIPKVDVPAGNISGGSNFCNQFTIADAHIGSLAWGEESGEDYDISIATELFAKWFKTAVHMAPPADTAVLCLLGDFSHIDNPSGTTPSHGHILDVDSRFQKVVRTAIQVVLKGISIISATHNKTHIVIAGGNHDPFSSVWLRELIAHMFAHNEHITVDTSPSVFNCFEWGKTSLFYHHGDKVNIGKLPAVMASEFRDVFGRTEHSYCHVGHYHHIDIKESNLMVIEQHRTLAARDSHTSSHGYKAGRDAQVITYHKEFGEVARVRVSKEMLDGNKC